ncbi:NAD(P)-dependent alcohol dehydrogenase [Pseudoxanthomonas mexicana]|nr:NAD(P)-dependent alcohol dehydrogenase [Pseudoxanthomonas mexicana]
MASLKNALCHCAISIATSHPNRPMSLMHAYRVIRGQGPQSLHRIEVPPSSLGENQVLLAVKAASLNYRDLLVAHGQMGAGEARIPLSDAAGQVVAVGSAITDFSIGDAVLPIFFPRWTEGFPSEQALSLSLGGNIDGVLTTHLMVDQSALVHAPRTLSWEQASTIACAGVTAWHALFELGALPDGAHVLIQGTGGVSTWAVQLALAAGLHVTVLSGRGEGIEHMVALGAHAAINYNTDPNWGETVLRTTGGVDLVMDIGGADTIARSLRSLRPGGQVVTIGGVAGGFALSIDPFSLIGGKSLTGVVVGSKKMTQALIRFIDEHAIVPVIDIIFPFAEAAAAFARMEHGRPIGKVVIAIN